MNRGSDGTHITAWIRLKDQVHYCDRKGLFSQNVMAMTSFHMIFQHVFVRWKG